LAAGDIGTWLDHHREDGTEADLQRTFRRGNRPNVVEVTGALRPDQPRALAAAPVSGIGTCLRRRRPFSATGGVSWFQSPGPGHRGRRRGPLVLGLSAARGGGTRDRGGLAGPLGEAVRGLPLLARGRGRIGGRAPEGPQTASTVGVARKKDARQKWTHLARLEESRLAVKGNLCLAPRGRCRARPARRILRGDNASLYGKRRIAGSRGGYGRDAFVAKTKPGTGFCGWASSERKELGLAEAARAGRKKTPGGLSRGSAGGLHPAGSRRRLVRRRGPLALGARKRHRGRNRIRQTRGLWGGGIVRLKKPDLRRRLPANGHDRVRSPPPSVTSLDQGRGR